jgi:uncharacterized membrane protein YbhN (UPF0104 family)
VRRWLALVLAGTVLAGLGVWLARAPDALAPLWRVSPGALGGLVAVSAAALVVQGAQFGVLARLFGLRLRPAEWLGLTCINNLMTYSVPVRGGTLLRAGYLYAAHGFPLHAYAALTVSSHVVITGVVSWLGMATALALALAGTDLPACLLLAFGVAPVVLAAAVWGLATLGVWLARASVRLGEHATAFRTGLGAWRRRPRAAAAFAAVTALVFGLHALRVFAAFAAVELPISVPAALLLQAAIAASAIVAVTPANLGTREAVIVLLAAVLGVDGRTALLAAVLERAVAALEAVVGSAILARPLHRHLRTGVLRTGVRS